MPSMSERGYNVVKSFEGRALKAYRDVVGVWTIGYGNTNSDAAVLGFTVKAGVTITEEQADSLLRIAMEKRYMPTVNRMMGPAATQNEVDGGGSFAYNCGTGAMQTASWVKDFQAGRGVKRLALWNKAGGKTLAGLTRRRAREIAIIESSAYGPEGRAAPPLLNDAGRVVGVVGKSPPVVANIEPAPTPVSIGMLRLGDQSEEVRDLQTLMVAAGYRVNVTGSFDAYTEKKLKEYQGAHPQLTKPADGVAGPATRAALQRTADMKAKAVRTTTVSATAAGGATADQTAHAAPFLPTWSLWLMGVAAIGAAVYIGWTYRDEASAWIKAKFA